MTRTAGVWISPLVAMLVLGVVVAQTLAALQVTGAFGWHASVPRATVAPAYQSLDHAIDRHDASFTLAGLRDPFGYGHAGADRFAAASPPPPRPRPDPVVVVALPVLTAIVWDNDPRALVRWQQREWTVREGGLFDEFQVVSITRDQVTLRRGDETLVLNRRNPGE